MSGTPELSNYDVESSLEKAQGVTSGEVALEKSDNVALNTNIHPRDGLLTWK
jgi:hypothetical protein